MDSLKSRNISNKWCYNNRYININNSIQIQCKNFRNRVFQIKFDECIIFQKINDREVLY